MKKKKNVSIILRGQIFLAELTLRHLQIYTLTTMWVLGKTRLHSNTVLLRGHTDEAPLTTFL